MKRFIVLTFLFLGWAFYEASGGADFVPRSQQKAEAATDADAMEAKGEPEATAPESAAESEVAAVDPPSDPEPVTDTEVAEQVPEPTLVTPVVTEPAADTTPTVPIAVASVVAAPSPPQTSATEDGAAVTQTPVAISLTDMLLPRDTPLDDAQQEVSAAPETDPPAPPSVPQRDLRQVTGSRVNMRDGPGTIYPVIATLSRGDQVEVLDDSGTGWLQLQPVDGGRAGWMSERLISSRPTEP